jgi:hypothetical protein
VESRMGLSHREETALAGTKPTIWNSNLKQSIYRKKCVLTFKLKK